MIWCSWDVLLACNFCYCSEFLYALQLEVKDDPWDLLTSVCGMPDTSDKSRNNDIVSWLLEGQVVNLVCS